ncbi:MAG: tyrosine-type recombinase/integrase [Bacillota bacterium]
MLNESDAVFLNRKELRLLQKGIYEIIKKAGKKEGLNQGLHPHLFRHTFATNLLERSGEIEFIADEMGHAPT